jgi:hypothetical protein
MRRRGLKRENWRASCGKIGELTRTNLINNFSRKASDVVTQPVVWLLLMILMILLLLQQRLRLAIVIIPPAPTIVRCRLRRRMAPTSNTICLRRAKAIIAYTPPGERTTPRVDGSGPPPSPTPPHMAPRASRGDRWLKMMMLMLVLLMRRNLMMHVMRLTPRRPIS